MIEGFFVEFSIIVLIAVVCAGVMKLLRQPLIIGYILAGIIISPYALDIFSSADSVSTLAQVGVALLLFMVGLNLNPSHIRDIGGVSLSAGLGQIVLTFLVCFFIAKPLGFSTISSVYIAIALTFSSTIIVMKLLSDKGLINSLHGRILTGFLIVQDIVAIVILMIISSLSKNFFSLPSFAFFTISKGFLLFSSLFLFGVFFLPRMVRFAAKSQEFLLLFSIGWCLALSVIFLLAGFSVEIGALLAGITLSLSPYRFEISARLRPLRDFFIVLFFILLGSQMVFSNFRSFLLSIIIFSAFTLFVKPVIIMSLLGLFGYTKRTGFLSGITLAQISEFSFIVVALGVKVGHLPKEILSLVAFIGLLTIAGSTYFIRYNNRLYSIFSPVLGIFEKRSRKVDEHKYHSKKSYEIILFGLNRIGHDLLKSFKKIKKDFLVVDFNPETILDLAKQNIDCRYGDAGDTELLKDLNLHKTKMIVSTIPSFETNSLLINFIRKKNRKNIIIVVSHDIEKAIKLYKLGASYVIMPHFLGGSHTSALIKDFGFDVRKFLKKKVEHIAHLKNRRRIGHNHPKYSY